MERTERISSSKRAKTVQIWDRDIICLPQRLSSQKIAYPRGSYRSILGEQGLIGKIRLMSNMDEDQVRCLIATLTHSVKTLYKHLQVKAEVHSVFQKPMGGREDFPFEFLQATGSGTRSLTVPAVSSSFRWTAQQVAKLGGYKQAIYILAKDDLVLDDFEVNLMYA